MVSGHALHEVQAQNPSRKCLLILWLPAAVNLVRMNFKDSMLWETDTTRSICKDADNPNHAVHSSMDRE